MYVGDIRLGDTIDVKFTTRSFSTGAPTQLAGTPVVSAYPGNSTTQLTAGITLSVDFDTVTGLNNVRVVASSGNGYATATNYALVITTGTVGGVSVVGETVASFSIEARSALMPTTAARTLDVSATGEAGVDWGNVGSPTTAVNLSATNIDTDQVVASVSGAVGSVTGAVGSVTGAVGSVTGAVGSVTGNVGGNVTGSVGSVAAGGITAASIADAAIDAATFAAGALDAVWSTATRVLTAATNLTTALATPTNITAGTITTVTNLTNAPTAGDLTATMKTSVQTAATASLNAYDPPTNAEMEARTILAANYATAAALAVVDGNVDDIEALALLIDAVTDQFVFTVVGQVDANLQSINDTTVLGDGGATPWGP